MTDTATDIADTIDEIAANPPGLVQLPVESLNALMACGEIVRRLIRRSWDGLENPNQHILGLAAAWGLMVERAPTEDEIASGEFEADDTVLALSPAFAETMAGFDLGMEEAMADMLPEPDDEDGDGDDDEGESANG